MRVPAMEVEFLASLDTAHKVTNDRVQGVKRLSDAQVWQRKMDKACPRPSSVAVRLEVACRPLGAVREVGDAALWPRTILWWQLLLQADEGRHARPSHLRKKAIV